MAPLLAVAALLAGAATLALEAAWLRWGALLLGGTAFTAALVVGTFFLAAAAGCAGAAPLADRLRRPWRLYGAALLGAAALAAALALLRPWLAARPWPAWTVLAALVAPPALLLGTALPAWAATRARRPALRTRALGALYALELAGAAAGAVLGGVVLPGLWGVTAGALACCGLLAAAGLLALLHREPEASAPPPEPQAAAAPAWLGWTAIAASGLLTAAAEVLLVGLARLAGAQSLHTGVAVLAAAVLDLALGAALAAHLRRRGGDPRRLLERAAWTGTAAALSLAPAGWALGLLPPLPAAWTPERGALLLAGLAALGAAPLLVPAGMVFPLAWELAARDARPGAALGAAGAANKAAAGLGAIAPLAALPAAGLAGSWALVGLGYAALAALAAGRRRRTAALLALALGAAAAAWPLPPVAAPAGSRVLSTACGAHGVVAVAEDAGGSRHLVVDRTYLLNGTQRALLPQRQQAWLPLALAPDPRRVLVVGVASGITADAVLDLPVEELVAAELVGEVLAAARAHFAPWSGRLFADPRVRLVAEDGRRVLAADAGSWDVVVIDLLLPRQDGTNHLWSGDLLALARARLRPGGLCCLWLPMWQLDEEMAEAAAATFLDAFPCALALRGSLDPLQPMIGLVGAAEPIDLSTAALAGRLARPEWRALAERSPFLRGPADLRLALAADLRAAADRFAAAPRIGDDGPWLSLHGARPIADGRHLRALTLLRWLDALRAGAALPSLAMDGSDADDQRRAFAAGANLFFAAINRLPLPGADAALEAARRQRLDAALARCRQLAPGSTVAAEDLDRN